MSRRISVKLYDELKRLRPEWHDEDDEQGEMKIVMTGSVSDDREYQPHIRNKKRREDLATRFKRPMTADEQLSGASSHTIDSSPTSGVLETN